MVNAERGEPWFEDGNLLLKADGDISFKIHRGVLARQSEVFKDMLAIPQPPTSASQEGNKIETVRMYDLPVELSNLLMAIYDGVTFHNRDIEDFFFLASILRLSTKYFIEHLRRQAIEALARTWSFELEGHDAMVERALQAPVGPGPNELTYPYVHPVHVLNLARETNVRIIIPSAMYFLSVYPFNDLLQASHPKLAVESRSGLPRPSATLSAEDMSNYTLMYQHRIEIILDYIRHFLGDRRSGPGCLARKVDEFTGIPDPENPREMEMLDPCSRTFARLSSRASRSWYTRTGPLRWMLQTQSYLELRDMRLCRVCKETFRSDFDRHRRTIWEKLPSVVGLPSWENLIDSDLPGISRQSVQQPGSATLS